MKNSMIISLTNDVRVVCYREDMLAYFYAEYDYTDNILDVLYDIIKSCEITSIICVVQGFWNTKPCNEAYISGSIILGETQYFASVSQLDINKMQHLFKACEITDVSYVDAFAMYNQFANAESGNSCIVDRVGSGLVLAVYTKNEKNECVLREIFYVIPANLSKYIVMLKRKYNIDHFVDSSHCSYVGDIDCSKFTAELQQKICALSAALNANAGFRIDNSKIGFSADFNSYKTEPETKDVKIVEQPKVDEESGSSTDSSNEEFVESSKRKGKGTSLLLTILVILCILSLIGVMLINNLIQGDINGLKNKIKSLQVEVSSLIDTEESLHSATSSVDYGSIYSTLEVKDTPGIELVTVSFQSSKCTATYFVAGEDNFATLLAHLGEKHNVLAVVETSTKEDNGVLYAEKVISLEL